MSTRRWLGIGLVAALSFGALPADADDVRDLSLFTISKSENRNQVVYAVRVDRSCRPVGPAPVHAYWQNLEQGPTNTSPLLFLEQPAYGIASQEPVGSPSELRVRLRALPDRPIVVHAEESGERCVATARTQVASSTVTLTNVYARLKFLFGVESITLTGNAPGTGAVVHEVLKR